MLAGLLAIAMTPIGDDYGLRNLFWHDDPMLQASSGAAIAAFALLLWSLSYLRALRPLGAEDFSHLEDSSRSRALLGDLGPALSVHLRGGAEELFRSLWA